MGHGDHIICYVLISQDIYPTRRIICGSCIFPYFHSKNTLSLLFSTFPNKNRSKEIDHAKYYQQKKFLSTFLLFYNMYWLLSGLTGTSWGWGINTFYWNNSFFNPLILDLNWSSLFILVYFLWSYHSLMTRVKGLSGWIRSFIIII
jgi:hypothetical protein